MLHIRSAVGIALIITALCADSALAWNKAGHMVSAAIAYEKLKQDSPQTVAKVVELMQQHPQADLIARRLESVPEADRERYLFMLMARWPDDIRGDADFDMPEWHYINYAYKPPEEPEDVQTALPAADNIVQAFKQNRNTVTGNSSEDEKAIALCWIFHLIGDVHQPLHTATLFTKDFPSGDRGGTRFYIRARPNSSPISLHKFWDDLILGSERHQSVRNRAIELRNRPELAEGKLHELSEQDFEKWAKSESLKLAEVEAYREGKLPGSADKNSAPSLPGNYVTSVKPIAERRVVLAGYRLANVLKQAIGG